MDPLKLVVLDGDNASFLPQFGVATVTITPPLPTITGKGKFLVNGKRACVKGDEKSVTVNAMYIAGAYSVPGQGTVTIETLGADQTAPNIKGTDPVIIKGTQFTAKFKVSPGGGAKTTSSPPVQDTTPEYLGTGQFVPVTARSAFAG